MLRHCSAACLVASLATFASVGTAEGAPARRVELNWTSEDPRCIDEAGLARTVESTLGRPVLHAEAPAAAIIEGRIDAAASGKGFRASITMRSPSGEIISERAVTTPASSCDRLDEAVALIVALMVDSVQEESGQPAPATPPEAESLRVAPEPPRAPKPSVEGEIGGALTMGLLPGVAPSAYARLSLAVERASLSVAAQGLPPSRTAEHGPSARIHAWAFDVDGCYALTDRASWRILGCALVGVGWMDATPFGTDRTESVVHPLVFGGASIEGAWRLDAALWLHVRSALWSPFESPEYFFQGRAGESHTVFRPWAVAPSLSLGVGWRFNSS
jgi:hypothetical protein